MAAFTLRFDASQMDQAIRQLKGRAPYAMARSLNRSAASACTVMIRVISQDTGIKQADLRGHATVTDKRGVRNRSIWVREAHPGQLTATVYADTERIPLMDFGAKQTKRGVTARIQGRRRLYPGLFIARMQSGHEGVFGRNKNLTRKSRGAWGFNLPITERRGPSVAHVWEAHAAEGIARANEQLLKNIKHEFKFAASQSA